MPEPLLFRHPNGQAATSKNEGKSVLGGRRPSASLQAYFLIPMWSSRCVGEHSGSTLFGGPSARINWRHELARMISRLSKEALDQGLGIAEAGSTIPRRSIVGRNAL